MKFAKLSIFALTMGLFVASCGNSESEAPAEDTTVVAPVEAAPAVDTVAAPAVVDTTVVVDTTKH